MPMPLDPLTAATHDNPYPYYAELVATTPLYYDAPLGLWVVSSANMVAEVLSSPYCRVRPVAEPVPTALLGSPAADVFRHLVRMNDGADHCPFKQAVAATLASVSATHTTEHSHRWARALATRCINGTPAQLDSFALHMPVYVVGSLLGFADDTLPQLACWMDDFVRCLAASSSVEQLERGKHAAAQLRALFTALLDAPPSPSGVLATLAREMARAGRTNTDSIIANGIGLLAQAYEATAGLIGSTMVLLADRADLRQTIAANPAALTDILHEVLRYDAPIQNTRRFVAQDGVVAGQTMRAGAMILLVLAAANRDPAANPDPMQFDPWRAQRRLFTFGVGVHACPGDTLAPLIAQAGVEHLMSANIWPSGYARVTYRPSTNARVPLLGQSRWGA